MSAQSVLTRRPVQSAPVRAEVSGHAGDDRRLGIIGIGAGLLFGAMSVWQHAAGLDPDGSGAASAVNQAGFALAIAGYLALALGLYRARPGGDRREAGVFPALLALAWTALLAGLAVESLTSISEDDNVLFPIGGALQVIGLAGLGITTVVAGRWTGWRRFWALGFAVFFVGAVSVPAIAGVEPGVITEVIWALGYAGLGAALVAEHTAGSGRTRVLMGVAVVALLGSAIVVASTSDSDASPTTTVPVVEQRPILGSADVLERQAEAEAGPRLGSADVLERQAEVAPVPPLGSADVLERQAESGQAEPESGPPLGSADVLERQAESD